MGKPTEGEVERRAKNPPPGRRRERSKNPVFIAIPSFALLYSIDDAPMLDTFFLQLPQHPAPLLPSPSPLTVQNSEAVWSIAKLVRHQNLDLAFKGSSPFTPAVDSRNKNKQWFHSVAYGSLYSHQIAYRPLRSSFSDIRFSYNMEPFVVKENSLASASSPKKKRRIDHTESKADGSMILASNSNFGLKNNDGGGDETRMNMEGNNSSNHEIDEDLLIS